jgi:hypothetical protein
MSTSFLSRSLMSLAVALSVTVAMALSTEAAWAGPGYQPDSTQPSIDLAAEVPVGVAIDQTSQVIYVAELTRNLSSIQPGLVEQLSPAGLPTANSPFGTGGQDLFAAVAVNPTTHGIYAYQGEGETPVGPKGTPLITTFSSTGALGTSFAPTNALPQTMAVDPSGRIIFPNNNTHSVQIFSPSGTVEGSVTCGGCPGGTFSTPQAVAFDSAGKLYVVDSANGGRVLKLSLSGGSYAYESTLQSGEGAVAVAVDSSNNSVFVGDVMGGTYHVAAFDSSGSEFDDFAAGAATKAQLEVISGQLAVNSTTHDVYLSDPGGGVLRVFEPIASIPVPTATIAAPNPVGQVEATLKATVNPKGHVLTSCNFEYTDHADFLANGYVNAETAPCPAVVGSPGATTISAGVKGLAAATSYDYRIKVESHGGLAESTNQSFQTLPALPPEVTTGAASSLTKTGATLGGTVNPKGGTISNCHFEYVTQASFQGGGFSGATSKSCATTPSGNAAVAVSAKVTGLEVGTAYRFRVVATNNAGTTQATDATFTTVFETCAENPAFCPPSEIPQAPSPPVQAGPAPSGPSGQPQKPLKCRKGFKKKRVRGKLKCVRVKKHRS